MAFWGLEVKPGKQPAVLNLERRLVVKQAALVVAKPDPTPCVLSVRRLSKNPRAHSSRLTRLRPLPTQVSVGDAPQQYVVCRLHEGKVEHCTLELPFSPSDNVNVHLKGPHPVHLTGFLELDDEDELREQEADGMDDESDGEDDDDYEGDELDEFGEEDDGEEDSGEEGEEGEEGEGESDDDDEFGDDMGEDDFDDEDDDGEEDDGEEEDDDSEDDGAVQMGSAKKRAAAAPPPAQPAKKAKAAAAPTPTSAGAKPAKGSASKAATPASSSGAAASPDAPNTWSNAEDKALKAAMAKFGPETPSRWDKVAKAVGTSRSGQQCKKREQWLKKNQA